MSKTRILYLTKVNSGSYYITKTKPIAGRIKGTRKQEMEAPFDPMDFRHVCEPAVQYLMGSTLPPLTPKRIRMTVELLD
jgi:hypothetical protein